MTWAESQEAFKKSWNCKIILEIHLNGNYIHKFLV